MEARVIFSKELQRQMKKGMTRRQRGAILYQRLKDADESGGLGEAKNRKDVLRIAGYPGDERVGLSWVSNLIRRGHLEEIVGDTTVDGEVIYMYSVPEDSGYGLRVSPRKKVRRQVGKSKQEANKEMVKATVTKGDVKIELCGTERSLVNLLSKLVEGK